MGNVVGTSAWAPRDKAFYAPPHPLQHYDENVEAFRTLMPRFDCLLSHYSVSTTGHVVCHVALLGFGLMPQRDTASWRTFRVAEVSTRAQLEPSLITGKEHFLVYTDTISF